jgi:3-phytase
VDEEQGILLVADEFNFELEVYGLDGQYLERTVGSDLFTHGDPEGIMLYRCGEEGYWILTDQGETRTVFHLLDRVSMEPLGSFAGEVTANTDGIWLEQGMVPGVGRGALFALHDDGGLSAFSWETIAERFELQSGCSVQTP